VVPVLVNAVNPSQGEGKEWVDAIFFGVHSLYISPLVTLAALAALVVQRQKASALSLTGLAVQAIVFAAVALSWIMRVIFLEYLEEGSPFPLGVWYELVGWAAVDNGVFAIVQAVLFCLSKQRQGGKTGEEQPLL
jgi:hypothetical protein